MTIESWNTGGILDKNKCQSCGQGNIMSKAEGEGKGVYGDKFVFIW